MKALFSIYISYSTASNDTLDVLYNSSVLEDNRINREMVFDDYIGDYGIIYDSVQDFLNGKINKISFHSESEHPFDTIGGYVEVTTYDQEIERIRAQLIKLNDKFEIEI